ncbi:MAG: HU family DNA-binding protein [Bacteroidia bacterium]|nr:HU family DNA-binding protein [Bacteroidia bacterium]HQV01326.1 HU family DNA-binding protein [Bacteroidia bacterium]
MTKSDLVNEIHERTGIEKTQIVATVEAWMKLIKNNLGEQKAVYLRGFGTFYAKKRAAKMGRVITRNEQVFIPEHHIPAFKPAKSFMSKVKNAYTQK